MATYRITAPDGTVYNVTGEGTEEEALAQVQAQHGAGGQPAQAAPNVPDVNDLYRQNWPTTAAITDKLGRIVTNAIPVTGVADLIGTVGNIAANKLGVEGPRYQPVTPMIREGLGVAELPANAPRSERILENAASIALGGGGRPSAATQPGVVADMTKRGVNSVIDATAGDYMAEFGQAYGGDLGALTGALASGGVRPAAVSGAGAVASKFGNSEAGPIYDAARRIGVQPTAGMVGNDFVGGTEKSLSSLPGVGAPVNYARDRARGQLEERVGQSADIVRGGPATADPVLPGHIGEALTDAARTERALSFDYAKANAENIGRTMAGEPVRLDPVDAAYAEVQQVGRGADLSPLASIYERLQGERPPAPVIAPAVPGRPAVPPSPILGPNGQPVTPGSPAVPGTPAVLGPQPNIADWEVMQNVKQGVGAATAQGGIAGRHADIMYGGIKDAERAAANAVEPGLFDLSNEAYATNVGKGGVIDRLNPMAGGHDPRYDEFAVSPSYDPTLPNAGLINRGLKAPEILRNIEQDIPPEAMGPVYGNVIDRLGRPATQGPDYTFSPTKFAKEWNAVMPESQGMVTQTPPQSGIVSPLGVLEDVATAGQKYDLPPQAYGLTKTLGSLGTAMAALGGAGAATGGLPAMLMGAAAPLSIGAALESAPVVRGIAGRYSPFVENFLRNYPATVAPNAQNAMNRPY